MKAERASEQDEQSQELVSVASSDPERIEGIFERMEDTLKKITDREGREPEIPTNIRASGHVNIFTGIREYSFSFRGQEYAFKRKGTLEEFRDWITEYSKTAESCITCDGLLFEGEAVGLCSDGLMHLTRDCCPSGGFFAGHINNQGKLEPYNPKES